MSTLAIVISHLRPEEVESGLGHLRTVAPELELLLCHGGRRDDFEAIDFDAKLFMENPGLRGEPARHQSYNEALAGGHAFAASVPEVEHVIVLEFDQVVLRRGFAAELVETLERSGADFLGKGCCDRTGTNWPHRFRYADDDALLELLSSISVREDRHRFYGCLGTGFVMRRAVLDAFASVEHPPGVYVELYVPTLVHHLGFKVEDIDRVSDLYRHVRWSPAYDVDAVLELQRQGAFTAHPFKVARELERLAPVR